MLRADQDELLRWVLAGLDAPPTSPPGSSWTLDRFAAAGLATGLTAAVATIADKAAVALPDAWRAHAAEQCDEVAARQERFAAALPSALAALAEARVDAVPVKGAVLVHDVWPFGSARPMADIDLVVAPADRSRAGEALAGAGFTHHASAAWEDTFLAWGDGGVGRRDGESREHNGKVELHPGWVERLHGYLVDGTGPLLDATVPGELAGRPCRRLEPAAFAAHVLGHLGACAIRGEVRAVNVVDAVLVLRTLDDAAIRRLVRLVGMLDPRPVGAGLWLANRYRADVPRELATSSWERLPRAAQRALDGTHESAVLRQLGARTTVRWRLAWAITAAERRAVLRQALVPAASDIEHDVTGSLAAAQARRVARVARRVTGRVAGRVTRRSAHRVARR